MLEAMTVPSARLLAVPLRNTSVTVPCVVGFHCKSRGWPAEGA